MQAFADLIDTSEKPRALQGSHISGENTSYQYWVDHRAPIVNAIHRPGTILDIGCANGFLLRSLMVWSEHELVPYGIEPDEALLERCRALFVGLEHHFSNARLRELDQARGRGLPEQFDFVYWCVWDDFEFGDARFDDLLEQAPAAVKDGGRFILGFYDGDLGVIGEKIDWLDENFRRVENRLDSATKEEVFVWFDT